MGLGLPHLLILLAVVVLLFGSGKVSSLMGDVAKGIREFKKGLSDDETTAAAAPVKSIDDKSGVASSSTESTKVG